MLLNVLSLVISSTALSMGQAFLPYNIEKQRWSSVASIILWCTLHIANIVVCFDNIVAIYIDASYRVMLLCSLGIVLTAAVTLCTLQKLDGADKEVITP